MKAWFCSSLLYLLTWLLLPSCQSDEGQMRSQAFDDKSVERESNGEIGFTSITFQKRGSFELAIFGTRMTSDEGIASFTCEFADRDYETLEEAVHITRYKSPAYGDYFQLMTQIVNPGTTGENIMINGFSFEYNRKLSESKSLYLHGSGRDDAFTSAVTHYRHVNGNTSFDFEVVVDGANNSTKKELRIKGRFYSGMSSTNRKKGE